MGYSIGGWIGGVLGWIALLGARTPVLMALLLSLWRWLTAPAEGMESPPARSPRVHSATDFVAHQRHRPGGPFFAPIHAPLPRLLS